MTTHATRGGDPSNYPPRGYAWYMVVLLTVAYIFSFIDRYIVSLVIEPLKADLALSDTQIGLLMGTAFALFFGITFLIVFLAWMPLFGFLVSLGVPPGPEGLLIL